MLSGGKGLAALEPVGALLPGMRGGSAAGRLSCEMLQAGGSCWPRGLQSSCLLRSFSSRSGTAALCLHSHCPPGARGMVLLRCSGLALLCALVPGLRAAGAGGWAEAKGLKCCFWHPPRAWGFIGDAQSPSLVREGVEVGRDREELEEHWHLRDDLGSQAVPSRLGKQEGKSGECSLSCCSLGCLQRGKGTLLLLVEGLD